MTKTLPRQRIQSIDLLRGIVMVLMALDHVRDFFHHDSFFINPTNVGETTVPLFLTRWITHFCAPVFVFLAGTSAYFVGQRLAGKKQLSFWLLKRGFWLIFLEFTVIKFAWFFTFPIHDYLLMVIWAIGAAMIALAGAIHLKKSVILSIGLLLVAGHNAFDFYTPEPDSFLHIFWNLMHVQSGFNLGACSFFIVYPLTPWIGLMLLGYLLGTWYHSTVEIKQRSAWLRWTGMAAILLFLVLRLPNLYGEPNHWSVQPEFSHTVLSFINVSKYPPSLQYALITIGIALLFLSISEGISSRFSRAFVTIGRVPMFYYILHIYLIHGLAMLTALITGYDPLAMMTDQFISNIPELQGYGFSLGTTYLIWLLVLLCLYPVCAWYNGYKDRNRHKWWLSYL